MILLGKPAKLVRMVKTCILISWYKINLNSVTSEEFTVNTGIRLGDALSLVLFHIALELIVRRILLSELQSLNIGQGKQVTLATNR